MKKFLLALLFLIPVIIIFSIGITANVISAYTVIPATEVRITDEINKKIPSIVQIGTGDSFDFYVSVYPRSAYNHNVTLRGDIEGHVEDLYNEGKGVVSIEAIVPHRHYRITGITPGEASIRILSDTDEEIYSDIDFFINGKQLSRLDILFGNGETVPERIEVLSAVKLYASVYPVESIGDNEFKWKVKDESVASVDGGYIIPKAAGTTTLSVSVTDLTGKTETKDIILDTRNAKFKFENIKCANVPNVEWVKNNIVVSRDDYVNSEVLGAHIKANYSDGSSAYCSFIVDPDAGNKSIEFLFVYNEVFINNGGYKLTVKRCDDTDTGKVNAVFSSGDERILKIGENGNLIFTGLTGSVTLTAYDNENGVSCSMTVDVLERIRTFSLNMTETMNKAGLKSEKVWALNFFDENLNIHRNFKLYVNPANTVPYGAQFNVKWITSDPSVIITGNGEISFANDAAGKTVTVTAVVLTDGVETYLRKTYTFKFIDDMNAVNVYNTEQFHRCTSESRSIVLHDSLYPEGTLNISSVNLYGNGNSIYGDKYFASKLANVLLIEVQLERNYIIENVNIYGRSYQEQELHDEIIGELFCIYSGHLDPEEALKVKVNISYCQFINGLLGNSVNGAVTYSMERCIMSNISGIGILARTPYPEGGKISIDRMIIKNSKTFALFCPPTVNFEGQVKEFVSASPHISVSNLLSYSWAVKEDLNFLADIIEPGALTPELQEFISSQLATLIQDVFSGKDFSHLRFRYNGTDYYHLGFASMGLWSETYLDRFTYTSEYIPLSFRFPDKLKIFGVNLNTADIGDLIQRVVGTKVDLRKTNFMFCYDFVNGLPKYLPNQPVPSDAAMYEFIRGA